MSLFDPSILRQKIEGALKDKNQVLIKVFNRKNIEVDEVLDEYLGYAEILRPYVADTVLILDEALKAGKTVLLEGSQGTLLDATTIEATEVLAREGFGADVVSGGGNITLTAEAGNLVLADNAAVLTGRMNTDVHVDGVDKALVNRVSTVWTLNNGAWQMVVFQSTPMAA